MYGISNAVQPYIGSSFNSTVKATQGKTKTDGFASQFQSASVKLDSDSLGLPDWDAALTEAGKSSTGDKQLTPVEKQYLMDKYDVTDLSDEDRDALLAELTNEGVLSYSDYRESSSRLASATLTTVTHKVGAAVDRNAVLCFQNAAKSDNSCFLAAKEKSADGTATGTISSDGLSPEIFQKLADAHQHIADILETLVRPEKSKSAS